MKLAICAASLLLMCGTAEAAVEDPPVAQALAQARDLYGAAEYEHALGILDRLRTGELPLPSDVATLEQYRALCLLALGRPSDAEQAITALVFADPAYTPPDSAMSPRLRATFRDVRAKALPQAIQKEYDKSKAAFDRREFAAAAVGFSGVLRMMADPDISQAAAVSPLSDLKKLAEGFRDLSTTASAPPPPPPVTTPPVPRAPAPPAIFTADDAEITAPVAVNQALPPFPAQLVASRNGILDIVIDERGAVESAVMRLSVNPRYDRLVLDAVRSWHYRPATRAGVPVKYRKVVQIVVVKPQ